MLSIIKSCDSDILRDENYSIRQSYINEALSFMTDYGAYSYDEDNTNNVEDIFNDTLINGVHKKYAPDHPLLIVNTNKDAQNVSDDSVIIVVDYEFNNCHHIVLTYDSPESNRKWWYDDEFSFNKRHRTFVMSHIACCMALGFFGPEKVKAKLKYYADNDNLLDNKTIEFFPLVPNEELTKLCEDYFSTDDWEEKLDSFLLGDCKFAYFTE